MFETVLRCKRVRVKGKEAKKEFIRVIYNIDTTK